MRKRGLAIHSETIQEYIQLSEIVGSRPGFFYDASPPQSYQVQQLFSSTPKSIQFKQKPTKKGHRLMNKSKKTQEKSKYFHNFDYDVEMKEYEDELNKLQKQQTQKLKKCSIVLISQGNQSLRRLEIMQLFGENTYSRSEEQRKIDLVRRQYKSKEKRVSKIIYLNLWLIDRRHIEQPLIQPYLNSADEIFIIRDTHQSINLPARTYQQYNYEPQRSFSQLKSILGDIEMSIDANFH